MLFFGGVLKSKNATYMTAEELSMITDSFVG
jgi:hypothetical protein